MTTRSPASILALCLAALSAACYSPTVGSGQLACSEQQTCPDGYSCASNGFCYQNGAAVPPDAPTAVTAAAGVRSAAVSWTAPAKDGGSAITSYTVTAAPGGLSATTSSGTSVTLSGLENGTQYTFTVIATNAIGNSAASSPSAPITTFALPGAPAGVIAAATASGATLDWSPPADTGGTAVTGYVVQASLNAGDYVAINPQFSGTHAVITGLTAGGSYTFVVAAVNAVGEGPFSTPSNSIQFSSTQQQLAITAPQVVTAGQTGATACTPAVGGATYDWTIAGGALTNPDGAAGELAGNQDCVTFDVAGDAAQVALQLVETAVSGAMGTANVVVQVDAAPMTPVITAAPVVTVGDTGLVAQVPANAGMTYSWALSSSATLRGSDLHGVTANGINSITYDLNSGAAAGGSVQLSVVETNGAQASSAPGMFTQGIAGPPQMPTLVTAPPAVAPGEQGVIVSTPAHAGMTYAWTLAGANFSSGSSAAGVTSGGTNSISIDVTAAAGGGVQISVAEVNAASKSSAAYAVTIPVVALPGSLAISVARDDGASPPDFQTGATQYATAGAQAVKAEVPAISGASYAWSISGGGAAHAGESGASSTYSFDVTGAPGDPATGAIHLQCVLTLGGSSVTGTQDVAIVAAPGAPAISLDGQGASLSLHVGDGAAHTVAIASPVATSTYALAFAPAADGTLDTSATPATFTLAAAAQAGDTVTFSAIETNAAGRSGPAGTATIAVLAELATPAISASSSAVAPGQSYTAQVSSAQPGVTYQWSIDEQDDGVSQGVFACSTGAASGPNSCLDDGSGGISFTVDPAAVPGHTTIVISLSAADGAGGQASAAPVTLPVLALPAAAIAFGSAGGDAFGANITAGGTRTAFAPAGASSYAWTLSTGAIESGQGTDQIVFDSGDAPAGTQVTLQVVASDAAGGSTATAPVNVVAAPSAPSIGVASEMTDPGVGSFGAEIHEAALVPGATPGVSYRWTVTGGATCTADGTLCGIAPIAGSDPSRGTFEFTLNAALGATLSFSAVAIDAAGNAGPASSTATSVVIAAPLPPAIAATFTIPGAPAGSSFTSFAPGQVYDLSIAAPRAGFAYDWTFNGQPCGVEGGGACRTIDSRGIGTQVEVVLDGSITSDGSAPAPGDTVSVVATEISLDGDRVSSAAPLVVPVIAAPAAPAIELVDHQGAAHAAPPYLATEGTAVGAFTGDPSGSGLSFLWSATTVPGGASVLDANSAAGGNAGTDPDGDPDNFIDIDTPAYSSGESIDVELTALNAASFAAALPLSITVEPAPALPTLSIPQLTTDVRTPPAITYGAIDVEGGFTVEQNADGSAMAYACAPDQDIASVGSGSLQDGVLSFTVASSASGSSATLACTVTNAAGDSISGDVSSSTPQGVVAGIPIAPPLAVVALTPASGAAGVGVSTVPTILFSYAPDSSTVSPGSGCNGSITLEDTTAEECVAATLAQSPSNPALFTLTPGAPLAAGDTYLLDVKTSVADLQRVPLAMEATSSFTVKAIPDVSGLAVTPHLQSAEVSWTNPSDPSLNHLHVRAIPSGSSSGLGEIDRDTSGATAASLTLGGLVPGASYEIEVQVAEDAANTQLSPGVGAATTLQLSGAAGDFTSNDRVAGLGPTFNGENADSFYVTWGQGELYFGVAQPDGMTALRNSGDALWIAVDADPAGADSNGESSTVTGATLPSGVSEQIIWPFKADYVLELKNQGGGLITNLRTVAAAPGSQWAGGPDSLIFNGAVAEVGLPAANMPVPGAGGTPSHVRLAFAFVTINSDAVVYDLAPAAWDGDDVSDGHTPATDVLGQLASITNSLETSSAFDATQSAQPLAASHRAAAKSLVTLAVDATAQGFGASDVVQLFGNLPPLSYTLSQSSYALADDGTRGSANSAGRYSGVFNFGITSAPTLTTPQQLFFEFAHAGSSEPLFGNGADRVWTLSGASESVGTTLDPLVWNTPYSASHAMTLQFLVHNGATMGASSNVVTGNVSELGPWNAAAGAPLSNLGNGAWESSPVTFTDHDFVSGGSSCGTAPAPPGCALEFKAVNTDSGGQTYENDVGNRTMNDDVINTRVLEWTFDTNGGFTPNNGNF